MAQSRLILERRQQDARKRDLERSELAAQLRQHNLIREANNQEDRIDMLRRLREERERKEVEQRRAEIEEFNRAQAHRAHLAELALAESQEAERIRLDQLRREKQRQSIRETCVELRELEQKLNYAYMNKERAVQIKEKKLAEERVKAEETALAQSRLATLEADSLLDQQRAQQALQAQLAYKHELQKQLEDAQERKRREYEMFLKDKAIIDGLVERIREEDEAERQAELSKQAETQRDLAEHLAYRQAWKLAESQRLAEENRRIAEHAAALADREARARAAKKDKDEEKNALYQQVARTIEGQEKAKAELEELRIEVYRAEQDEKERQQEQAAMQKRIRARLDMLDSYRRMLEMKRERQVKEREEEKKVLDAVGVQNARGVSGFRPEVHVLKFQTHVYHFLATPPQTPSFQLLKKYQDDEALEQLTARARRQRMIDYKIEIDRIIAERRMALERERQQQAEFDRASQEVEEYRRGVIEMERQRLLREHAAGLVGYLPKGVLRDMKDLEAFDESIRRGRNDGSPGEVNLRRIKWRDVFSLGAAGGREGGVGDRRGEWEVGGWEGGSDQLAREKLLRDPELGRRGVPADQNVCFVICDGISLEEKGRKSGYKGEIIYLEWIRYEITAVDKCFDIDVYECPVQINLLSQIQGLQVFQGRQRRQLRYSISGNVQLLQSDECGDAVQLNKVALCDRQNYKVAQGGTQFPVITHEIQERHKDAATK
ncbi:mannosyl-oligosaccharide alpha-1,2-mannosidase [Gonapodya sp. JEL0774]|nr:mannosyl-oligosaccharide alpha-1,2-mannosidase [Gonapodya sp. JEL0774]